MLRCTRSPIICINTVEMCSSTDCL